MSCSTEINLVLVVASIDYRTNDVKIAVDKAGCVPQLRLCDSSTLSDGCVQLLKDVTGVDARKGWITPKLACVNDVIMEGKRIMTFVYNAMVPSEIVQANKYDNNTLEMVLKNNRTLSEMIIQGVRNV